ncbi:MAG: alginate O-acetyltransferase AlgX-related protein [Cellulosilyticaceae bacterium]
MKQIQKHHVVALIFLILIFSIGTLSLTSFSFKVVERFEPTIASAEAPTRTTPFLTIQENLPIVDYDAVLHAPSQDRVHTTSPTTTPSVSPSKQPTNPLTRIIQRVESEFTKEIVFTPAFINLYGGVQNLTGKVMIEDADATKTVIKDEQGFLQFYAPYISSTIDQNTKLVATAKVLLKERGIPLLYVQPPVKIIEDYTTLPEGIIDYTNTNVDRYLLGLRRYGVQSLDLRTTASDDTPHPSKRFFKTDHHWTTQTAFWAFDQTIQRLGELGVLDPNDYTKQTALENYNFITYPNSFLGSQGRRVGQLYGGLDDYTLITPKYPTDYQVTISHQGETTTKKGTFEEAILVPELLDPKAPVSTNRYAVYFGQDHAQVVLKNKNLSDKKLLIIQNSYGLPYSAFLSTCFSETHILDLRFFDEITFEDYLGQYTFDAVIILDDSLLPS